MTPIVEKLEVWARWKRGEQSGDGVSAGYGRTFLEKALSGMPTTRCTGCNGVGKVPGSRYNMPELVRVDCMMCGGRGRVVARSSEHKINPAFIHSTNPSPVTPFDEEGQIMDEVINRLSCLMQAVLYQEYLTRGNQKDKASRVDGKRGGVGISQNYYSETLKKAHAAVAHALAERLKKNDVRNKFALTDKINYKFVKSGEVTSDLHQTAFATVY